MPNYSGNLWITQRKYILGNKTQYPLFLGTIAGTLLLYLYCDFVLLLKYCDNKQINTVIILSQMLSLYNMFKVNMTEPGVIINEGNEQWGKFCDKCSIFKPTNAYHCKFCEHCVYDFEAHCFLLGTCIGRRNKKYLLGLVTFTGIVLYSLLAILIIKIFQSDCNKEMTFIILNMVSLSLTIIHLNPFILLTWKNASQVNIFSYQNQSRRQKKKVPFNLSPSFIYYNYLNFFINNYESNLLKYISI